jgi:hypothetical protein
VAKGDRFATVEERLLWNSVLSETSWFAGTACWEWIGPCRRSRAALYPSISFRTAAGPRSKPAHRVSLETFRGVQLGKRHEANHLCGNTICINPMHLEKVTRRQNEAYKRVLAKVQASTVAGQQDAWDLPPAIASDDAPIVEEQFE